MKKGLIWVALTCLIVTSMVLASCNKTTTATTSTSSTPATTTTTKTTAITTTSTTVQLTSTTTTTAVTGNWWDSLGTPQYGNTLTLRYAINPTSFDPYFTDSYRTVMTAYMERLSGDDWTLNPTVFNYQMTFRSSQFQTGDLAKSWEFTGPGTFVVHLRQGIYWQNITPANGREFTSADLVYHYDREEAVPGGGFTVPAPARSSGTAYNNLTSVTATDKYTVVFQWSTYNPEFILETMLTPQPENCIECPDAVKLWGDLNDWHHAIGTGPFILQDYVSASSATLVKNPNYWAYDERYPQNRLPYIDTLKILVIPDDATALAAMRTGKIDAMDGIPFTEAQDVQKTNPNIMQIGYPQSTAWTILARVDNPPFTDVKVRQALQMAIDLPTIAKSYYLSTADPWPSSITSNYMTGWSWPYLQWPQDLKDQFAYNPTAAKKLLADAGYPNGFNTDIVADTGGDMSLMQIVTSYWANIGVNATIKPMDTASFASFVSTGHKQDALSYRSVGILGVTTDPFRQLNIFATGNAPNNGLVSDPVYDAMYVKAIAATTVDEAKQILAQENQYVAEHHFGISLLQPRLFALVQPWFKGYNGQMYSIYGTAGAQLMYFYCARFWIDQKVKTSMGY